ncbi:hypothetical protein ACVWYN_002223 [Pedobacter sp. UYP24]
MNLLKAYSFLLLLIAQAACAQKPDLANIKFTEHASSFLKGIAAEKNSEGKGLISYRITNPGKVTIAGAVIDHSVEIGAQNDIIAYYDIAIDNTVTTNKVLNYLLATYKAPTKKMRDDGNTRAYYWISPTLFIKFMSGEQSHSGKKEIFSLIQVGAIKAFTAFADADITRVYHFITGNDEPVKISKPKASVSHLQPDYHVAFSSKACRFVILVNDVPAFSHTDKGDADSEVPINHLILHSGPQTLSAMLLPLKGQTKLSPAASLQLKVTRMFDDAPDETGVPIASFPAVKNSQKFTFNAQVPYTLAGWQKGADLSHLPASEVISAYQRVMSQLQKKNFSAFEQSMALKLREIEKATYTTAADSHKEYQNIVLYLSRPGTALKFDTRTAQLRTYGNGKIVALVQPNFEPALHAMNAKEGEDYQIPLLFFKKSNAEPLTLIR